MGWCEKPEEQHFDLENYCLCVACNLFCLFVCCQGWSCKPHHHFGLLTLKKELPLEAKHSTVPSFRPSTGSLLIGLQKHISASSF